MRKASKAGSRSGAFLGTHECACGSRQAEIYVGDDVIYAVCIECGEVNTRERQPHRRKKPKRTPVRATVGAAGENERRALVASMEKVAARIDRRHGRGKSTFGQS